MADPHIGEGGGASPPLAQVLAEAARVWHAFVHGRSLERALDEALPGGSRLRPAVQSVSYSAVRRRALSERVIAELAARPPAAPVAALLCVALPQLLADRHAAYAVVDQAVTAARADAATDAAAGFVNALLRNFLRQDAAWLQRLQRDDTVKYNAPRWWIDAMRAALPAHASEVLAAGAAATPPLTLRVNTRRVTVDKYLERLAAQDCKAHRVGSQAVCLSEPRPVARIDGFEDGVVSVQDAGAQLAAPWLDAANGARVLDACAAPGGKTAHLVELADLDLTAIESDAVRATRIDDNLRRVGGSARVLIADAADPAGWWDGRPYDRILLDAPCSASGIVRRHPDIPWLRRKADVAQLTTLQARLLGALWPLLDPGGRLLYVVCSVFPAEGSEQIARFVERYREAAVLPLPGGSPTVQLLPTLATDTAWAGQAWPTVHDGFFYALLEKPR
jgi:16S rRNA (cytosine967-C5)-methyltransferase